MKTSPAIRATTIWRAWSGSAIPTTLMMQQLNRLQNTNDLLLADARTGERARACPRPVEDLAGRRGRGRVAERGASSCGSASTTAGGTLSCLDATGPASGSSRASTATSSDVVGRGRRGRMALLHRVARERHRPVSLPLQARRHGRDRAADARGLSPARTATTSRPDGRWRSTPIRASTRRPSSNWSSLPDHRVATQR